MEESNRQDGVTSDDLQALLKEKKKLEAQLSAVEKKLPQAKIPYTLSEDACSFLAGHIMDVIFIQDMDLNITYVSPSAEALSGYSVAEILNLNVRDLMTPDSYKRGVENVKRYAQIAMQRSDVVIPLLEYEYVKKDDSTFWGELKVDFIRDKERKLVGMIGVLRDITRRKTAEKALRENEGKYRTLFNNVGDAIVITDAGGNFLEVNKKACEHFGYTRGELLQMNSLALQSPNCKEQIEEFTKQLKKSKTAFFETEIIKKDRAVLQAEVTSAFFKYSGQDVILSVIRDITEKKKLESQFLHSQKMEAIGRLAGGIAHDFNNLLTTILGYSEIMLMNHELDQEIAGFVGEIKNAGDRAASLTQQLLAYSRKQIMKPEILNLNNLITGFRDMLIRLIGENIELCTSLYPQLWNVSLDRGQMEQVIMNLVVNARDAISEGGKITIETGNVISDKKFFVRHPEVIPGEFVLLTVRDTGHGMDKTEKQHIFDPFYTTKEVGKGTGLGLSTVYGIVKQSEGYIFVESGTGEGTVFELLLPRVRDTENQKRFRHLRVLFISGYADDSIDEEGLVEDNIRLLHKPFSMRLLVQTVREVIDG